MRIIETEQFRGSFNKLDKKLKIKVKSKFKLFLANFRHQSLHTEKLEPKSANRWSFRVDKCTRVIFTFAERQTIILLDIGPHDIYKK